jgi:hypothetical protein
MAQIERDDPNGAPDDRIAADPTTPMDTWEQCNWHVFRVQSLVRLAKQAVDYVADEMLLDSPPPESALQELEPLLSASGDFGARGQGGHIGHCRSAGVTTTWLAWVPAQMGGAMRAINRRGSKPTLRAVRPWCAPFPGSTMSIR